MINKLKMKSITLLLFSALMIASCTKEAGPGGLSSIQGKVIQTNYDNDNTLNPYLGVEPSGDTRVYIIYGNDDNFQDADVRTSFDGSFRFTNLNPGDYRVYTYTEFAKDDARADSAIVIDASITEKNQKVDIGEIYIHRWFN